MNIVMFGPPGAGKGTQAAHLATALAVPHIASGDLFRAIRRSSTPLAREIQAFMDRGELVPDGLTDALILGRLGEPDACAGFILDGYPRTVVQAQTLEAMLVRLGRRLDAALFLKVPAHEVIRRLSARVVCARCGATYNLVTQPPLCPMTCDRCSGPLERRSDEQVGTIAHRLEVYRAETEQLAGWYRRSGLVREVDGARSEEEVRAAIAIALGLYAGVR
ncbi:MAG TPA: adenylate kinase [Chloroflexota bacterium]|nr:adenylate kinase [Chloroflexota bacterium]